MARRRPRKHLSDGSINPLWQPVKTDRRKKPLRPVDPRAEALVTIPFPCANCDLPVLDGALYCSELCRDEAKYVRQYRIRIDDDRILDPDVRYAMRIRLAHILAGGYDERARKLPQKTRRLVFEQDDDRCRKCGTPGTEIDHISGPSPELDNLQLLCFDCHRGKTMQSLRVSSRDENPEVWAKADALGQRVESFDPVRICDSPDWNAMWPSVRSARRRAVAEAPPVKIR